VAEKRQEPPHGEWVLYCDVPKINQPFAGQRCGGCLLYGADDGRREYAYDFFFAFWAT